jgi:hypothetical protein
MGRVVFADQGPFTVQGPFLGLQKLLFPFIFCGKIKTLICHRYFIPNLLCACQINLGFWEVIAMYYIETIIDFRKIDFFIM